MILFGPISSVFDFATFAVMLWVFHAGAARVPLRLVRRVARHPDPRHLRHPHPRVPFFRSRPSLPLTLAALAVVAVGARAPADARSAAPSASRRCPAAFFAVLVVMVVGYLVLVEIGKRWFYRAAGAQPTGRPTDLGTRFVRRRAARFSVAAPPANRLRPGRARAPGTPAATGAGRA